MCVGARAFHKAKKSSSSSTEARQERPEWPRAGIAVVGVPRAVPFGGQDARSATGYLEYYTSVGYVNRSLSGFMSLVNRAHSCWGTRLKAKRDWMKKRINLKNREAKENTKEERKARKAQIRKRRPSSSSGAERQTNRQTYR